MRVSRFSAVQSALQTFLSIAFWQRAGLPVIRGAYASALLTKLNMVWSLPWLLTFWAQNLISSSLSPKWPKC